MWGIWDKDNREYCAYYAIDWNIDEEDRPFCREGVRLFMFETPIEAEEELQSWNGACHYEVIELPADEPEWIYL